jgi:hypothetical protein
MKTRKFLLLFLSAILASACNPQLITPSLVPSEPSSTATTPALLTPVELTLSPTATPIPTVTRTPLPTLSPEEREKLLAELLQTNGNCSRPCFWGIIPSTSDFDDSVAFLKSLGRKGLEGIKDSIHYYNVTYNYKDELSIGLAFQEHNGNVENINAGLGISQGSKISNLEWSAYQPDNVIKTYGTPSSIKIGLGEGPDGRISYQLLLTYDAAKLYLLYDPTDVVILPAPVLHTCPLAEHGISKLDMWLGKAPEDLSKGMKDIEEVSSLTIDDFSNLVIHKKERACFDIDLKGVGNR